MSRNPRAVEQGGVMFETDSVHGKRPTPAGMVYKTFIALALVPPAQATLFLIAVVKLMGEIGVFRRERPLAFTLQPCQRDEERSM